MWSWFRIEVRHRESLQGRKFEVGCQNEREALAYGRIWLPEDRYKEHRAVRLSGKPATEVKANV